MATDIVIPLGTGSRHGDAELRYCLRSVERHLVGVGKVIIVGHKPGWMRGVVHIPMEEQIGGQHRAHNIYSKLLAGIGAVEGREFLYMNDDHFLLADYYAPRFPLYHRGKINLMQHRLNLPQHRQYMQTLGVLQFWKFDFGVHCPMLIIKSVFNTLQTYLPEVWPDYGYEVKSLYGNLWADSMVECTDLKFHDARPYGQIKDLLTGRQWFSVGDRTLNKGGMMQVLQELYPNPSKYEQQ